MTDHFIVCMGTISGSWQICHMHLSYVNVVLKLRWGNTSCDPKVFRQIVLKEYCALHLAADTITT